MKSLAELKLLDVEDLATYLYDERMAFITTIKALRPFADAFAARVILDRHAPGMFGRTVSNMSNSMAILGYLHALESNNFPQDPTTRVLDIHKEVAANMDEIQACTAAILRAQMAVTKKYKNPDKEAIRELTNEMSLEVATAWSCGFMAALKR